MTIDGHQTQTLPAGRHVVKVTTTVDKTAKLNGLVIIRHPSHGHYVRMDFPYKR